MNVFGNSIWENIDLKSNYDDRDWTESLHDVMNGPEEYFSKWLAMPLRKVGRMNI